MRYPAALLLASTLASSAHADVLRVGPAQQFAEVADAVSAATNGDLILVAPGTYASFDVDDLSLIHI